jgi:hypothetical protein
MQGLQSASDYDAFIRSEFPQVHGLACFALLFWVWVLGFDISVGDSLAVVLSFKPCVRADEAGTPPPFPLPK